MQHCMKLYFHIKAALCNFNIKRNHCKILIPNKKMNTPKKVVNQKPSSQLTSQENQKIARSASNLARASDALERCDLCCNMMHLLFKRTITNYKNDFKPTITNYKKDWIPPLHFNPCLLFNNDIASILAYRLVSKAFKEFFSYSHTCSILAKEDMQTTIEVRGKIPDPYENYRSKSYSKSNISAKERMEPKELFSIDKKFNVILEFRDIHAGKELTMPDGLDNIIQLSFWNLFEKESCSSDNTISKVFHFLSTPSAGDLKLPKSMDKLIALTFNNISRYGKLWFPSSMKSLKVLEMKDVSTEWGLDLPETLPNLELLKIGSISEKVTCKFPSSLESLTHFELGDIWASVTLTLPNALNNLKKLVIGHIKRDASLQLPKALPALINFEIKHIFGDSSNSNAFELPLSINKLKVFTIAGIRSNLKFPENLDELERLDIGFIDNKVCLELPKKFPALENLKIGIFGNNVIFQLPDALNNLTYLFIGSIHFNAVFKLSSSCNNLQEIVLEKICSDATVELPDSLNSLTRLTIGNIYSNVKIKLPDTMPNLKTIKYNFFNDGRTFIEKWPLFYLKLRLDGIQFPPSLSILFFVIFITWLFWS